MSVATRKGSHKRRSEEGKENEPKKNATIVMTEEEEEEEEEKVSDNEEEKEKSKEGTKSRTCAISEVEDFSWAILCLGTSKSIYVTQNKSCQRRQRRRTKEKDKRRGEGEDGGRKEEVLRRSRMRIEKNDEGGYSRVGRRSSQRESAAID